MRDIDVTDRQLEFGTAAQSLAEVEVVLTDRINEVVGFLVDGKGKPAPGSYVIIFSMERDRWYPASRFVRFATAVTDGAIALPGLPAGSYYAAAVTQLPSDGDDAWQDPEYLDSLTPLATRFDLGDGEKRVVNLKVP